MANQPIDTQQFNGEMPVTRWSMVREMGQEATCRQEMMEIFARDYWPAVYAYARRKGYNPQEAEDVTQSFLARLIERESFENLSKENGRFRSWLLACFSNFLRVDRRNKNRQKRGGGAVHIPIDRDSGEGWLESPGLDGLSPEVVFDRRWAAAILERALAELARVYEREGKGEVAKVLLPVVAGGAERESYADAAQRLGIAESSTRVAAHRIRKRLRHLVREEIAATVSSPQEVDQELAELFALYG